MKLREPLKIGFLLGLALLLALLGAGRFKGSPVVLAVGILLVLAAVWALKLNRVFAGLAIFLILVGFWEFKWKPQYRPYYEQGVAYYQKGRYLDALNEFTTAYNIDSNKLDVILMMGWANLKLKHFEEARFYFERAIIIDPRTEEAQMGAAFVALETGRGTLDVKLLNKILGKRGGDPNARILAAGALVQEGSNLEAAAIYRDLVNDRSYGHAAQVALEELYGLKGFASDRAPEAMPEVKRPAQTQVRYRAAEGAMWQLGRNGWEKMYVDGINLGPEAPGYHPSSMPTDGEMYATWVQQAAQLNANVVRAYTLLPPAFYRAFKHYLDQGGKLMLYQQVWVSNPPNKDLYDDKFMEEMRAEIRYAVDALHGRGNVRPKKARGSGLYLTDVSSQVGAILLGSELSADVVARANVINAGKTKYDGKYISISNGDPAEVWYAQMLDYLVSYETETYNWQHPVAIADPPTSNPARPTEAKMSVKPAFYAGLFAAYAVFPYYPEMVMRDPQFLRARDSEGPNPVYGYLRDLRAKLPYPLVVSAVGIPSSIGIVHFQATGWNQGGHSEDEQAEILTRLVRGVREAGCAGGLVFELMDEWYKDDWVRQGFKRPAERAPLWLNDMDPAERYGLIGYRTRRWALFAGNPAAWEGQQKLYGGGALTPSGDGYDADRTIRSVDGATDEGYLYLRINLDCLDCTPGKRDGKTHWDKAAFAVAINTLPGRAGIRRLPFGNVSIVSGANFLLYLGGPAQSKLLVADNYNPFEVAPRADLLPGELQVVYRRGFAPSLKDGGSFVEMAVQPNSRQLAQGPGAPPGQNYSFSVLRYGNGNPAAPDYNSLAQWYADVKGKAILVRIPWAQLLVADPSGYQVFSGYGDQTGVRVATSATLEVSVFALKPGEPAGDLGRMTVVSALPAPAAGRIQTPQGVTWKRWDSVVPERYLKKAYFALQKTFSRTSSSAGTLQKPVGRASALSAGME